MAEDDILPCLKLGIPFLAIRKEIPNVQDAIASQDAENKFRNDVSHYSNAMLYQRILKDGIFKTDKELADKLRMSASSLNELLAFAKIPEHIIKKIPNVHRLSKSFAVKIQMLSNKSVKHETILSDLAPNIGESINSPARLEKIVFNKIENNEAIPPKTESKPYKLSNGKKLFTFKYDQRGMPCIVFNPQEIPFINMETLCDAIKHTIEGIRSKNGYQN